jgi:hypothetical protein
VQPIAIGPGAITKPGPRKNIAGSIAASDGAGLATAWRRMVPAREALIAIKNDASTHHFTKFLARRLQSEPTRIRPPKFN